jgi:putative transposase
MNTIMKRRRHTPEQAVRKIREGERLLNEGSEFVEVLRQLEVSEATWNRWRAQYGRMKADEAKRLKQLEGENQRLKKLVAEQALDIDMLKVIAAVGHGAESYGIIEARAVSGQPSTPRRATSTSPDRATFGRHLVPMRDQHRTREEGGQTISWLRSQTRLGGLRSPSSP